jgi:hypothetical protein
MHKFFTIVCSALLLGGCATTKVSEPYQSRADLSFANNVLHAAGVNNVSDTSYEAFEKANRSGRVHDNSRGLVGATSYGVLSGINAGSFLSGGLGALVWMGTTDGSRWDLYPSFYGWIPVEMAADAKQAQQLIRDMLYTAAAEALAEVDLPEGYVMDSEPHPKFGWPMINGGECNQGKTICAYRFIGGVEEQTQKAPDFLGGYDAWRAQMVIYGSYAVDRVPQPRFPDTEVYLKMSQQLPEWLFGYMAPAKKIISHCDQDACRFIEAPYLVNQGQILLFVEPKPEETAAK